VFLSHVECEVDIDFINSLLLIPNRSDIERDAVAAAWRNAGGSVVRVDKFWESPESKVTCISLDDVEAKLFDGSLDGTTKTAVILIGIPASGKSSFYARFFKESYTHINLDTLHTRHKEKLLLEKCLQACDSFVVDNTNTKKSDRQRYIMPAKEAGYYIKGYFFQSIVSDCIARNQARSGKARISDIAISSKSNELEMPCTDEGFDELYFVKLDDGEFIIEKWRDDL
jgi:predicted kinase